MVDPLVRSSLAAFGVITTTPKIMRDPDTGNSRGFGFVSFETFEASDAANPYPYHVYHQGVRGALPTRAAYP